MDKNQKIPENYQTVMPYLIIKGAQKFTDFMIAVFNAKENANMKAMRDEDIIMHNEINIGGCTIMFADSTEGYPPRGAGLFIYVDDADETFKKAVDNGSTVINKVADQPYGRSGGVEDPFGNTWWITSVK